MLKDSVPATAEPITSAIKTPDGAKSADEPLTRPLANRPAPSALSAGFCSSLLPILYYLPSPPRPPPVTLIISPSHSLPASPLLQFHFVVDGRFLVLPVWARWCLCLCALSCCCFLPLPAPPSRPSFLIQPSSYLSLYTFLLLLLLQGNPKGCYSDPEAASLWHSF
jgi:hypothetical protein